jgi:hypothetical protein
MSSSLFYDCYATYDYNNYSRTKYVDSDKRFVDIKEGDILYFLKRNDMFNDILEIKVSRPWHMARGCYYISLNSNKIKAINFGTCHSGNTLESKNKSIAYYDGYIIGTNKDSVINMAINDINDSINNIDKEISNLNSRKNATIKELEQFKRLYKK